MFISPAGRLHLIFKCPRWPGSNIVIFSGGSTAGENDIYLQFTSGVSCLQHHIIHLSSTAPINLTHFLHAFFSSAGTVKTCKLCTDTAWSGIKARSFLLWDNSAYHCTIASRHPPTEFIELPTALEQQVPKANRRGVYTLFEPQYLEIFSRSRRQPRSLPAPQSICLCSIEHWMSPIHSKRLLDPKKI